MIEPEDFDLIEAMKDFKIVSNKMIANAEKVSEKASEKASEKVPEKVPEGKGKGKRPSMKEYGKTRRGRINIKVQKYNKRDRIKGFDTSKNVKPKDIDEMLTKAMNRCYYCQMTCLIKDYKPYDKRQYTLDRIDNLIGHEKSNCVIACYSCNSKRGCMGFNRYLSKIQS